MQWQTLCDPDEMGQFDNITGFGYNLPCHPQKEAGKTDCVTADQWLDRYTGWCEPFKARMSPDACKLRRDAELSDFCQGCKGIHKRSVKNGG
jgi:hypothetical protein